MKKKILLPVIVFLTVSAYAQQGGYGQYHGNGQGHQQQGSNSSWQEQSPDDRAKAFVSKFSEKVQVTPPQKDSLQAIFKKFFDDIELYKAQDSPDVFDELKTKRDDSVKRVLADTTKFAAYQNFLTSMRHAQQNQGQGQNQDDQQNWHHQGDNGNGDDQDFPDQNNPH